MRMGGVHLDDAAEDNVLAIKVGCGHSGDEELAAVGVGAGIGHAEQPGTGVLVPEAFVRKLGAVDAFAAGAVVVREVAALLKGWDYERELRHTLTCSMNPGMMRWKEL